MTDTIATAAAHLAAFLRRAADETAEGVISTAIAVLILAFVGAGMYVGFQALSSSGCVAASDAIDGATGASTDCAP